MNDIKKLIEEREKTHGDYREVSLISQNLKCGIRICGFDKLVSVEKESLDLICTKMTRILCGSKNNIDSWKDIAGYAQLIVNIKEKENRDG